MRSDITVETGLTDEQAEMTQANLGLISFVIDRNKHLVTELYDYGDAWQDGYFGLARAVQLFDPTRGFTFSTYATDRIRQAIQKGRGRFESKAWRAAYEQNVSDELEAPLSLDMPVAGLDGDASTLGEILPCSGHVEELAIAGAVTAAVREACVDGFDHAVLDAMLTGGVLQHQGAPFGYAPGSVAKRATRLRRVATAEVT